MTLVLLLVACVHDPEPAATPVAPPATVSAGEGGGRPDRDALGDGVPGVTPAATPETPVAGGAAAVTPAPSTGATDAAVTVVTPPPPLPVGPGRDPGFSLPVSARIEGPATAGECAVDADCAMAGCSHEVCVAAPNATRIVTTCEVLPAFDDLKACTCQGGECRWVHEAGARGLLKPGVILPR